MDRKRGEREMSERNMDQPDQLPPICAPTGAQTCNLGMCADRDSNLRPFGAQDDALTSQATLARVLPTFSMPNYVTHHLGLGMDQT